MAETIFKKNGKPLFVLAGQSHNSTPYSQNDLEIYWKSLDTLNANTAEIPIYWEAIEPTEGTFDFSSVDMLFEQARIHKKNLILLWFATWKNGNMRYAPSWVKQNCDRFKRVISHDGNALFVLSSHCSENLKADSSAFCALMRHLKKINTDETLLCVQVENEAGIAGRSYRDFSADGEYDYNSIVPIELLSYIAASPESELYRQWENCGLKKGLNWSKTFGVKNGSENLTAYSVASYINEVARTGKEIYSIPLYVNVALDRNPWGWNLPGTNYTAGGPIPRLYEIWKYATPDIDLIAPDIYFDCTGIYKDVCNRYSNEKNPLFIPESSSSGLGGNSKNMYYAAGAYGAIGIAAFGIEDILSSDSSIKKEQTELVDTFNSLSHALPLLVKYRLSGKIHSVVQEEFEGGYFFETEKYIVKVDYSKENSTNFIHRALCTQSTRGKGLIIEAAPDEFYILGTGFTVYFAPKDDIFYSEDRVSNHMPYLFVEEGHFGNNDVWQVNRTRTGDECDHGIWVFAENEVVHVVLCK